MRAWILPPQPERPQGPSSLSLVTSFDYIQRPLDQSARLIVGRHGATPYDRHDQDASRASGSAAMSAGRRTVYVRLRNLSLAFCGCDEEPVLRQWRCRRPVCEPCVDGFDEGAGILPRAGEGSTAGEKHAGSGTAGL
jgi:hypothetical protein